MNDNSDSYIRVKLLGEGAFGKAYLCEHKREKILCVIKEVNLNCMSKEERDETIKEAKILEVLKHPNIVKFKEVFKTKKGKLCIVMDFADGGDLARKLKEAGGRLLPEQQIIDWFTQICLALKHVHDRKILHRDLKTQNIFLTKKNIIKLGDFGIARVLKHTREKARTMVGTPYYLSPEILESKPYSFKSDIWSLGVILYELCALRPPFDGDSIHALALKIVRGVFSPISSIYSKELRKLLSQLLNTNPDQRPTVHQILETPIITRSIRAFLSESTRLKEFSHTILHKHDVFNPIANIERKVSEMNMGAYRRNELQERNQGNMNLNDPFERRPTPPQALQQRTPRVGNPSSKSPIRIAGREEEYGAAPFMRGIKTPQQEKVSPNFGDYKPIIPNANKAGASPANANGFGNQAQKYQDPFELPILPKRAVTPTGIEKKQNQLPFFDEKLPAFGEKEKIAIHRNQIFDEKPKNSGNDEKLPKPSYFQGVGNHANYPGNVGVFKERDYSPHGNNQEKIFVGVPSPQMFPGSKSPLRERPPMTREVSTPVLAAPSKEMRELEEKNRMKREEIQKRLDRMTAKEKEKEAGKKQREEDRRLMFEDIAARKASNPVPEPKIEVFVPGPMPRKSSFEQGAPFNPLAGNSPRKPKKSQGASPNQSADEITDSEHEESLNAILNEMQQLVCPSLFLVSTAAFWLEIVSENRSKSEASKAKVQMSPMKSWKNKRGKTKKSNKSKKAFWQTASKCSMEKCART